MDLQDAINMIAEKLPDGYKIIIEAERGYGGVNMLLPNGETTEFISSHKPFIEQIKDLIEVAEHEIEEKSA